MQMCRCESHERPKVSLSYPVLRIFAQVFDEYFQLFVKRFLCPPTDLFPVVSLQQRSYFRRMGLVQFVQLNRLHSI